MLTLMMVTGSIAYYPRRHWDSWAVYPIWIGGLGALLWHLVLILEQDKFKYVAYFLTNMALYVSLGFICLMIVTGEFL